MSDQKPNTAGEFLIFGGLLALAVWAGYKAQPAHLGFGSPIALKPSPIPAAYTKWVDEQYKLMQSGQPSAFKPTPQQGK